MPDTVERLAPAPHRWDTAYEWKAVLLMTLGFGLVGLDRWVLADLAAMRSSTMLGDLSLQSQDVGTLVAVLGIAWGLSSLVMGHLSDVWGRKRVIVPALLLFYSADCSRGSSSACSSRRRHRALQRRARARNPRSTCSKMTIRREWRMARRRMR